MSNKTGWEKDGITYYKTTEFPEAWGIPAGSVSNGRYQDTEVTTFKLHGLWITYHDAQALEHPSTRLRNLFTVSDTAPGGEEAPRTLEALEALEAPVEEKEEETRAPQAPTPAGQEEWDAAVQGLADVRTSLKRVAESLKDPHTFYRDDLWEAVVILRPKLLASIVHKEQTIVRLAMENKDKIQWRKDPRTRATPKTRVTVRPLNVLIYGRPRSDMLMAQYEKDIPSWGDITWIDSMEATLEHVDAIQEDVFDVALVFLDGEAVLAPQVIQRACADTRCLYVPVRGGRNAVNVRYALQQAEAERSTGNP